MARINYAILSPLQFFKREPRPRIMCTGETDTLSAYSTASADTRTIRVGPACTSASAIAVRRAVAQFILYASSPVRRSWLDQADLQPQRYDVPLMMRVRIIWTASSDTPCLGLRGGPSKILNNSLTSRAYASPSEAVCTSTISSNRITASAEP